MLYYVLGMKVGRLRVVFKLPENLDIWDSPEAPRRWPKGHLAYVEWYRLSAAPGQHHNMFTVNKLPAQNDIIPGDIIPLSTIRQSCQLIPYKVKTTRKKTASTTSKKTSTRWPKTWTSENVLDQCKSFLLNNWASKHSYQTIY
jgi:hypothetical protein